MSELVEKVDTGNMVPMDELGNRGEKRDFRRQNSSMCHLLIILSVMLEILSYLQLCACL